MPDIKHIIKMPKGLHRYEEVDAAFKGLGNGVQPDNDILCRQVCCVKTPESSALRLPRFIRKDLPMKEKRRTTGLAIHRISRSKRWVAPQRCPIYATVILSSNFWMIIPFTLKYVHTRFFREL